MFSKKDFINDTFTIFHGLYYIVRLILIIELWIGLNNGYFTSIPRLFAVPMIEVMIESILFVFIPGLLISAISAISAGVRAPIFFLFGSPDHIF